MTFACRSAFTGITLALTFAPALAGAQRFPAFAGVEARIGLASVEEASTGFAGAVDVDLGYVSSPRMRGVVSFDYLRGDIDRRVGTDPVGGDFSARGLVGALRIDAYTGRQITPYLAASLHAYSVDASSPNPTIEDLLSGVTIGAGLAGGLAYAFSQDHRTFGTFQVRRVFANNLDHWNVQVGVRYLPRGPASYMAVPRQPRALREGGDAERDLVRQEQERIAAERRPVEPARPAQPGAAPLGDLDALVGSVTAVRETDRGVVIVIGGNAFATGDESMLPRAREEMRRIAEILNRFADHQVLVEGHTDEAGQELANQRLSEQRAAAVRAALIAEGVAPQRLQSLGYGQSRPGMDGRTGNRRVEVVIVGARRSGTGAP